MQDKPDELLAGIPGCSHNGDSRSSQHRMECGGNRAKLKRKTPPAASQRGRWKIQLLTLAELEPLARTGLAILLPLSHPRITREKALEFQGRSQLGVERQ